MDKPKNSADKKEEIRQAVRTGYAEIARQSGSCCSSAQNKPKSNNKDIGQNTTACCCGANGNLADNIAQQIGYSEEDLSAVPEGANLGLGCGNPIALAGLKSGEVVLDLGSGAGFDAFLAAPRVGPSGKVIGVDMTPEMLDKARANLAKSKYKNVEFRLGEIENLPVADNTVDVIISNCVINLSIDKPRVFAEAFRVLKASGRLMVSDMVVKKDLPDFVLSSIAGYIGCVSGASVKSDYLKMIKTAGFKEVKIVDESFYPVEGLENDSVAGNLMKENGITLEEVKEIAASISSIKVSAVKP